MIKIESLSYTYRGSAVPALQDISIQFDFSKNSITSVLGESGSGKTTLLQCMAGFLRPQKGRILIDDKNIRQMKEKEFRSKVGVVFQKLNLFPHLTVLKNMTLALNRVQALSIEEAASKSDKMLERLQIHELKDMYPAQLSGGQAQRVAIARALVLKPRYLLLDEPTSALDMNTTEDFSVWLRSLHETTSFVIVTHDIPFARSVSKKAVLIENGQIKMHNKIENVMKSFSNS
ncbi:MAG TPA: ATP-binding cassette domain-containing protein [Chitinispirillaceae bacterium]|jgi:polar amino acid transport system ATP-binding protein|nr:ATP-binding cassette domain-containing protein [Chitinispirillaceae bacterium]